MPPTDLFFVVFLVTDASKEEVCWFPCVAPFDQFLYFSPAGVLKRRGGGIL